MYNINIILTYHEKKDDTLYRKEFLSVFSLPSYDNKILLEQEKIFNTIKHNNNFKTIIKILKEKANPWPFKLDDMNAFLVLFSYDYFYLTHNMLREYHSSKNISQDIVNKYKLLFK